MILGKEYELVNHLSIYKAFSTSSLATTSLLTVVYFTKLEYYLENDKATHGLLNKYLKKIWFLKMCW